MYNKTHGFKRGELFCFAAVTEKGKSIMSTSDNLLRPIDERYTVDQILTGLDRGKFAAKFHGVKIGLFDTMADAVSYTYQYQTLRMSSFQVTMNNLIKEVM
jgi:hypothetical protein